MQVVQGSLDNSIVDFRLATGFGIDQKRQAGHLQPPYVVEEGSQEGREDYELHSCCLLEDLLQAGSTHVKDHVHKSES